MLEVKSVTTNTSGETVTTYVPQCVHKLPCGMCMLTRTQCYKDPYMVTPTWNGPEITCASSTGGKKTVHIPVMDGVTGGEEYHINCNFMEGTT